MALYTSNGLSLDYFDYTNPNSFRKSLVTYTSDSISYNSNGDQITSLPSRSGCPIIYIGNGYIVYSGSVDPYPLYRKNVWEAGTGNGTQITTQTSTSTVYIGNGEVVYAGGNGYIYRKNVWEAGTGNGTQITTSDVAGGIIYIGNGEIAYRTSGSLPYKKSAYTVDTKTALNSSELSTPISWLGGNLALWMGTSLFGTKILSDTSNISTVVNDILYSVTYLGSGIVIYTNSQNVFFRVSLFDNSNTRLHTSGTNIGYGPVCSIGNGNFIYREYTSNFLKVSSCYQVVNANNRSGFVVNSVASYDPVYIGNSTIVYKTASYLYRKRIPT